MAQDRSQPQAEINFRCPSCRYSFKAKPGTVTPAPDLEAHPFRYSAVCPDCGEDAPQAAWERNLMQAWANATGPKTAEGKAAAAANLEGHPTPEEAQRTKFNAMKHGLNAKTATYFPAKPDGYSFCKTCTVDRGWCSVQAACANQTQLFMLHHAAFDQRNPKHLSGIYADMQAAVFAVIQQILQTILADGAKITTPEWYQFEGEMHLCYYDDEHGEKKQIVNIEAHPLLRPLCELLTRANLSLSDMGLTNKVIDDDDIELGRLKAAGQAGTDLREFAAAQARSFGALGAAIERAQAAAKRDPILIEHTQQTGG